MNKPTKTETKKYNLAPIDLNIPALPLFRTTRSKSDKPESYKSEDGTVSIGFLNGKPSVEVLRMLIFFSSKLPRKENGVFDLELIEKEGLGWTFAELCNFLGKTNNTKNRKTIREDLSRLNFTTLYLVERFVVRKGEHEMGYTGVKQKQPFEVTFHDEIKEKDGQSPLWLNRIKFDPIILKNLTDRVYRFIDPNKIKEIPSPVAFRIFTIYSIHDQTEWNIGVKKLAEQISIQIGLLYHTKQEIKKALEKLRAKNFIGEYEIKLSPKNIDTIYFKNKNIKVETSEDLKKKFKL